MARYIETLSATTTSVTVRLAGLDAEYVNNDRFCLWYVDDDPVFAHELAGGISVSQSVTLDGLAPDSTYDIRVDITGTGEGWDGVVYQTFGTASTLAGPSLEYWSWEHANVSTHSGATTQATDAQTRAAYTAVTTKGPTTNFSWLVWNDLVNYFVEVMWAAGGTWSDSYAWYDNTKMTADDRRMTAARFNSLRYNIDLLYSTGIPPVSKGGKIYGWYFTRLADCINEIISSL